MQLRFFSRENLFLESHSRTQRVKRPQATGYEKRIMAGEEMRVANIIDLRTRDTASIRSAPIWIVTRVARVSPGRKFLAIGKIGNWIKVRTCRVVKAGETAFLSPKLPESIVNDSERAKSNDEEGSPSLPRVLYTVLRFYYPPGEGMRDGMGARESSGCIHIVIPERYSGRLCLHARLRFAAAF